MATTPELRMVDPSTLKIGANVRDLATLDKPFLDSIKTHGVMQPIVAIADDSGELVVRMGQRRTLAAVEVGQAQVPVMVTTEAAADEAARIIEQMGENDHRAAISETDRTNAYAQLALIGLTAGQIARRTGRPRAEVEAAQAVNASEAAKTAVNEHQLSLTEAALVAEFDGDDEAVERVLTAAANGNAAYEAQRLRDKRAEGDYKNELLAQLAEANVTVVEAPPTWREPGQPRVEKIEDLLWSRTEREPFTSERHAECPGHAAYLATTWGEDRKTAPYKVVYVCTQPKKHINAARSANIAPMTDEQKAERRELIANNKAWDAAEPIRRAWLTQFAAGTTAPKGVELFIAAAIVRGDGATFDGYDARRRAGGKLTSKTTPRHALRLAAACLLSQWDAGTSRATWRNPSEQDVAYMKAMIAWGYEASEVERLILSRYRR